MKDVVEVPPRQISHTDLVWYPFCLRKKILSHLRLNRCFKLEEHFY